MKFVFIGTPEFSAIILRELIKNDWRPSLVITETDKPAGREKIITPPPVKIIAQEYNIPVLQPEKISNLREELSNLNPDLAVVAAYGQIIPKDILDIPKYGFINVHPSLLPKYRGSCPIQNAILNGDEETGVTIMLMDEKMDHGPSIANDKLQIADHKMAFPELHDELAHLGAKLLIDTIPRWLKGEIKAVPQNEEAATHTRILKKENGRIDWKKPASEIERQIRAFYPWPGTYTLINENGNEKILKIWKAKIQVQDENCPFGPTGKVYMATNEEIAVQTGKDFLIIEELQLEGKNKMKSAEFLKGRISFIGKILI